MANILYLVHKMRFDYSFGLYLRRFHQVSFMTSDPMIGLFLKTQQAEVECLYEIAPISSENRNNSRVQDVLSQTHFYQLSDELQVKQAFYDLCVGYVQFLREYVVRNEINLIVTQAKHFLDVACLTDIANELGLPICYLGGGFFRGQSCGFLFEPLHVFDADVWQKRWSAAENRPVVPPVAVPDIEFEEVRIKKPNRLLSLWQKAIYQRNPFWVSQHPDLRPTRSLFKDLKHQSLKASGQNLPDQGTVFLPREFVLLPLQGNEICGEMANPLGISNMEQLTSFTATALCKVNEKKGTTLKLVVKEHPARPGIISAEYKKQHPDILFLYKYPMDILLEKTMLVLTFNSLAGFEALQKYKPVITFAPLFYTLPELVYRCVTLDLLPDLIIEALHKGCDMAVVDDFIQFLKTHFDVPCPGFNRSRPTLEMFQKIHERIEGVFDFSQHHPASPVSWSVCEDENP